MAHILAVLTILCDNGHNVLNVILWWLEIQNSIKSQSAEWTERQPILPVIASKDLSPLKTAVISWYEHRIYFFSRMSGIYQLSFWLPVLLNRWCAWKTAFTIWWGHQILLVGVRILQMVGYEFSRIRSLVKNSKCQCYFISDIMTAILTGTHNHSTEPFSRKKTKRRMPQNGPQLKLTVILSNLDSWKACNLSKTMYLL